MLQFLNPVFLIAAGAAVIPLVLHLIQRSRTIRVPFSTIRFLKLAQRRSSRRIRLENFLLWLLRTLLMLGARAVLQSAAQKSDRLSRWAMALRARRGYHRAIIAVAAKNARIIWALLANNREFAPTA